MKSFCLLCLVFLLSGPVPAHADPGSGSGSALPLVEREFASFGEWRCRFTPVGVGSYCFLVGGGVPVLKVVALSPGKSGKYTIRTQIGFDNYYSNSDFWVKINNHGHEVSFRTVFDPENVNKKESAEEKKTEALRILRHEDILPFLKNISQGQSVLRQDTEDDHFRNRYRLDGALKAIGALMYVARAHGLKTDLPFEPLEKSEMLMPVRDMSFPPLPGKTVRHVHGQWVVSYKPGGAPILNFIEGPVNEGYDFSEEEQDVVHFTIFKDHDASNDLRIGPWAILETDFLKDLEQPLELWFRDGHHVQLRGRNDNDGTVFVAPGFQPHDVQELLASELLSSVPVAFVRGDRALMLDAAEDRGMLDLFRADINPETSRNYYLGTLVHTQ